MDGMAALHAEDLQAMIDEDHGAEIVCQYCGKKYQLSEDDLRSILENKKRAAHR